MKDALDETLILSDKWVLFHCIITFGANDLGRIIQDLVAEILVDVGALYKASEAVSSRTLILSS